MRQFITLVKDFRHSVKVFPCVFVFTVIYAFLFRCVIVRNIFVFLFLCFSSFLFNPCKDNTLIEFCSLGLVNFLRNFQYHIRTNIGSSIWNTHFFKEFAFFFILDLIGYTLSVIVLCVIHNAFIHPLPLKVTLYRLINEFRFLVDCTRYSLRQILVRSVEYRVKLSHILIPPFTQLSVLYQSVSSSTP